MKDEHFGAAFFDPVVSKFFDDILQREAVTDTGAIEEKEAKKKSKHSKCEKVSSRQKFTVNYGKYGQEWGPALGPDWQNRFELKGRGQKNIRMMKSCTVVKVYQKLPAELNTRYEQMLAESKGESFHYTAL